MKLVETRLATLDDQQLGILMELLDESRKAHKDFYRKGRVWRDFLEGKHWDNLPDGVKRDEAKAVINLVHAHVRSMMPTIYFRDPTFRPRAMNPTQEGKEETWKAVLNGLIKLNGFKKESKAITLDAIVYQEGWRKWLVQQPDEPEGEITSDKSVETENNQNGLVEWFERGMPVGVRISPMQMIVDSRSPDRSLEQARFVCVRYRKTMAEMKAHPIYGAKMKDATFVKMPARSVVGTDQQRDPFDDDEKRSTGDDDCMLYEMWIYQLVGLDPDKPRTGLYKQVIWLLEGASGNLVVRGPEPWENVLGKRFNRFPFNRLVLNPVPDRLPRGEIDSWHNLQTGLNWLMSRLITLVEQEKQLYEVDVSKCKNPEKVMAQLNNGDIRTFIDVTATGAVMPVQTHVVSRDNYQLVQLLQMFQQQVSGIGQNRRGSAGVRTATEASLIDQGTEIKTDEKIDTMSDFLQADGVMLAKLTRFITQDIEKSKRLIMRVAGDSGAVKWTSFSPEDLNWDPEIEIEVDSFRQVDEQEQVQKLTIALQQGMALFQLYGPVIRLDMIYRRLLKAMRVARVDEILGDQMDQEMAQMIEIIEISNNMPIAVKPTDNHRVHSGIVREFQNSQAWASMRPEAQANLLRHADEHDMLAEENSSMMKPGGGGENSFDNEEPTATTPANAARQQTAQTREATKTSRAGTGGQF